MASGVLLCLIGAGSASAQERITPEAFLDQAQNNTFTFNAFPGGRPVGVEQFLSRSLSVWARQDGRCTYGQIEVDDLHVCFTYDDDAGRSHCWVPFMYQDKLIVRSPTGELQQVSRVTKDPVQCTDVPIS